MKDRLAVIVDPWCAFCRACARVLERLDWRHRLSITYVSGDIRLHSGRRLTRDELLVQLHVISTRGRVNRGFDACRRIAVEVPALWPLVPLVYFPGAGLVGRPAYEWVARHRTLLSRALRLT